MSQSKNKKFIFIAGAAVLAVVAVLLILLFQRSANTYRSIKVIEMEGSVDVEREKAENVTAAVNMNLVSGDRITTGEQSYAVLQLDQDKYIMLGENGAIAVVAEGDESNGQTSIRLESGSVLSEIQNPLSEGSTYDINTPNATMSVRGTVFEVRRNEDEAAIDVLVYDGTVAVGLDGKEPVLYQEGEYTSFEDKEDPQFLIERGEITDDVMNGWVAERLEKISAEGRNVNAGKADLSVLSKPKDGEKVAEVQEETEEKDGKETGKRQKTDLESETAASEKKTSESRKSSETAGASKKENAKRTGTNNGTNVTTGTETVSSEKNGNAGIDNSGNNSNPGGSVNTPKPPETPESTQKPDDKKPKDTEKPGDKKPKDTEKPGDKKPDDKKPKDTQTAETQTPIPAPDNTQTPEPEPGNTQTPEPEPGNTQTPEPEPGNTQTPEPEPGNTQTPEPEPGNTQTPATETPSDTERPDDTWFHFNVVFYLPYIAQSTVDAQTGAQTAQVQYQWKLWYADNYVSIGSLLTEPSIKPESKNSPTWNGTPAPEGLTFAGWYLKGGSRAWNFASDRVVNGRELYAAWKDEADGKMYYPVVFEEIYDNTSYVNCIKEGSMVNLVPEKEGYKFSYWRTGSGEQWNGIVNGAMTLTPVWEKM